MALTSEDCSQVNRGCWVAAGAADAWKAVWAGLLSHPVPVPRVNTKGVSELSAAALEGIGAAAGVCPKTAAALAASPKPLNQGPVGRADGAAVEGVAAPTKGPKGAGLL